MSKEYCDDCGADITGWLACPDCAGAEINGEDYVKPKVPFDRTQSFAQIAKEAQQYELDQRASHYSRLRDPEGRYK